MALTPVQEIKLNLGLVGNAADILTDDELQYFLDKNNGSVKKASLDVAKTVLFILAQFTHEKNDILEVWNHTWFENYMKSLQLYLSNPAYSLAIDSAKAYAGGISITDIRNNIDNSDNYVLDVDVGIPKDGEAINSTNTNKDVFNPNNAYFKS